MLALLAWPPSGPWKPGLPPREKPARLRGYNPLTHPPCRGVCYGTFALTVEVPEGDPFYDDKVDILEGAGLSPYGEEFLLVEGRAPPAELLAMLRLARLGGAR